MEDIQIQPAIWFMTIKPSSEGQDDRRDTSGSSVKTASNLTEDRFWHSRVYAYQMRNGLVWFFQISLSLLGSLELRLSSEGFSGLLGKCPSHLTYPDRDASSPPVVLNDVRPSVRLSVLYKDYTAGPYPGRNRDHNEAGTLKAKTWQRHHTPFLTVVRSIHLYCPTNW